jgi:hypothetical protein
MKKLLFETVLSVVAWIFIITCVICFWGCTAHAWPDKFDEIDYAGQAIVTGLLVADWGQSNWATYHRKMEWMDGKYKRYEETNPFLGEKANRGKNNWYFPVCIIGHAAVSYLLPKKVEVLGLDIPTRTIWQTVWIGIEANQVYRNYKIGVGFKF